MADSLNGMVLGIDGTLQLFLKKTTDRGNSWNICFTEKRKSSLLFPEANYKSPRHLAYIDENNCFIALDSGNILKTNDGGLNWSKINITNEKLKCVTMYDAKIGGATTKKSLYITKDGWKTWQKSIFPISLDSNYFIDYNFVFINNESIALLLYNQKQYYIMKSVNLGNDWELFPKGKTGAFLDIIFINDSIGLNCLDNHYTDSVTKKDRRDARIEKTTDGGKSWFTVFDSSYYSGFWSMDYKDGVIFASGAFSRAYMSTDTGRTWIDLRDYNDYNKENMYSWVWCSAISKDEFLAGDEYSGVWKWTNTPNSVIDPNEQSDLFVFPNPATDYFRIKGNDGAAVSINNILGVKMIDGETNCDIDVSGLAPGIYFIRCNAKTLKFVKE